MFPPIYTCKCCGAVPAELVADPFLLAVWNEVEMMRLCHPCQVRRLEDS